MMKTDVYRDKVLACWLGKCLGGNLGMLYEGCEGPLDLKHDAVQKVSMPNDDLELQMLWLWLIEKHGATLRSGDFAHAWDKWYQADYDEYGVARWNIRRGLKPPLTGLHNNWFTDGMGAVIRSEIWACLFPGKPDLAAAFAREDACVDHAGDGVWAEVFLAAAGSHAFVSGDLEKVIDEGLVRIPGNSRVTQVVRFVGELWQRKIPVGLAREEILKKFGSHNFTDVCMNLGFIMLGLWYGQGEFEKSVLIAVNCGMDADCTAATTAAMLGILLGSKGISASWRNSVDDNLVYSSFLKELPLPQTIDEAVERTFVMAERLSGLPPDKPLDNTTPVITHDNINDDRQWFIVCSFLGEDFSVDPEIIKQAQAEPSRFPKNLVTFSGIHMDLSPFIEHGGDTLYLLTWLEAERDMQAQLMTCVGKTGITAWLDGRMIVNYHGRRKAVPALHRVEGGAVVPVEFRAGRRHLLKIRLLFCCKPLMLSVALADEQSRYLDGIKFCVKC
ncbi:MAG: ADP-ribosylglycohydrolase family protein [Verrucomicrobia bacterium]|nr:ADP-ribosylglycohydrolase family protein [Verrucomicrobiota bacterium]MBU1856462.1 ADP-ribosylglycohydrolase family protein [Verrucomicrobiota bacterium]